MNPGFPSRYETPHSADLLELWIGLFDNFTAWAARLVERLEKGEYRMADDS